MLHSNCIKDRGYLESPLILMWLEPYGLAGHVLVLNKPQDVFQDMFDDELSFRNRVVLNPGDFYEREAGCQSTYVPYSGRTPRSSSLIFLQGGADFATADDCLVAAMQRSPAQRSSSLYR